jgi:glycine oxidase
MNSAKKTADVVIVGGGGIGLAIARGLARRGIRDIAVLDQSRDFGSEASSAAAGILAPQVEANQADEFFKLACASRDMYQGFAASLLQETTIDVELDMTGTLYAGFNDQDETELSDRYRWQMSQNLNVEWLRGDEARSLEPNIAKSASCALRFPNDWQVNNRCLVAALIRANERLGVRLISNCKVQSLLIERNVVHGVELARENISAPVVVIAAGAWSSSITHISPALDIRPIRGQMLCFRPKAGVPRHVIYSSRGYLVPRSDGRLLAGSTSEDVGFDKRVTREGVSAIRSMAEQIMPALSNERLPDSWAGFRPRSADGLPVLGPGEVTGLFFATGHFRNGILLAPITGKLISEAIVDQVNSPLLSRFLAARFHSLAAAL